MGLGRVLLSRQGAALLALLSLGAVLLQWPGLPSSGPESLSPEAGCDLHRGGCRASDGGNVALTLLIAPLSIPVLDELQLEVRLEGSEARRVEVQFTGIDVDMGLLRYPLEAVGGGVFRGPAWLSVCSQRRMTWQALVLVDEGRYMAPFRFDTEYRRGFSIME